MISIMNAFTVTILIAFWASCSGYSYIIPGSTSELEHSGICYYNGHWTHWTKGYTQIPFACQIMRCNEDGSISVQGCRRLELPTCTLLGVSNYFKPFPDCCEMNYQCTDFDGNLYIKQWNQLNDTNEKNTVIGQKTS